MAQITRTDTDMTHRTMADYFAGINPADLNADLVEKLRKKARLIDLQAAQIEQLRAQLATSVATAWDEGYRARFLDGDYATNPYRIKGQGE